MTNNSRRRGFTLIELLIVIAIMGMLMTLLMPAVQSARAAAQKTSCANNLRNLAVANQQFNNKWQKYPSGGWGYKFTGDPDQGKTIKQPGGWCYSLLPYLDKEAQYNMGKGLGPSDKQAQITIREATPCEIFICPTRRRAVPYNLGAGGQACINFTLPPLVARGDYAANMGTQSFETPGWSDLDSNIPGSVAAAATFAWPTGTFDGVIYLYSGIGSVPGGDQQTYLFGERYIDPDHYEDGYASDDDKSLFVGYARDNMRNGSDVPYKDTSGVDHHNSFGSPHPGTFNMAFCDGHITPISYSIDPVTHQQLCLRFGDRTLPNGTFLSKGSIDPSKL